MASSGFHPSYVDDEGRVKINIHPLTQQPTKAWDVLKVHQVHRKVQRLPIKAPVVPNKVRFVGVSDTHNRTDRMQNVPDGDVLIHAGDFTNIGKLQEIEHFNTWLGTLPHKHKIVIAGNHELSFDRPVENWYKCLHAPTSDEPKGSQDVNDVQVKDVRELLTNCIFLEDSEVQVCGLRIYGSPWQPEYGGWAYNLQRGEECLEKWNKIPEGIDILMTHGPPIGHGDLTCHGIRAGCVELLHTVQHRVKPKYHIFGHIHEDPGITSDGKTKFINASTCTANYKAKNPPIIFDLDLPQGHTKEDVSFPASSCHGYTLKYGQKVQTIGESMETDSAENNVLHPGDNVGKNDKAENFVDYCEMADMSDNLGYMDLGLKGPKFD